MRAYDMADITHGRPTSARNLNMSTTSREAAIAGTPALGYHNKNLNYTVLDHVLWMVAFYNLR